MARYGQSLQEKARLANIGGDIRYGQQMQARGREAERLLKKRTEEAEKLAKKKFKGSKWLDFAKFASGFIPGGKAIGAGLNLVDMLATNKATKKFAKQFDKSIPKHLRGAAFKDYLQGNLSGLQSQLSQSLESQRKANMMQELLSGGMKLGSMPLFKRAEVQVPFMDAGQAPKISFLDKFLAKGKPFTEALEKSIPGLGAARAAVGEEAGFLQPLMDQLPSKWNLETPTMLDIGELGVTQALEQLQQAGPEATYPGAPGYTRRNLRGRIQ